MSDTESTLPEGFGAVCVRYGHARGTRRGTGGRMKTRRAQRVQGPKGRVRPGRRVNPGAVINKPPAAGRRQQQWGRGDDRIRFSKIRAHRVWRGSRWDQARRMREAKETEARVSELAGRGGAEGGADAGEESRVVGTGGGRRGTCTSSYWRGFVVEACVITDVRLAILGTRSVDDRARRFQTHRTPCM